MSLDKILDEAITNLEELVALLRWADSATLSPNLRRNDKQLITNNAAFSYIHAAAVTEKYFRASTDNLVASIRDSKQQIHQLPAATQILFIGQQLESLQETRDFERIWAKREEISRRLHMESVDDAYSIPVDAKTIRSHHFELTWKFFDLEKPVFPTITHKAALNEIANGRNEIAHGEISPRRFVLRKNAAHMAGKLELLTETLIHTTDRLSTAKRKYQASPTVIRKLGT